MEAHLKLLQSRHPGFFNLTVGGKSHEGRPLYVVKIGKVSERRKVAILMDGGLHAREWISPITVFHTMDKLVEEFKKGFDSNDITKVDWYFVPMANPDGYEYSRTLKRLWRKNRYVPPEGQIRSTCLGDEERELKSWKLAFLKRKERINF